MATADGGATWRQQYAIAEASLSAVDFVDTSHGWVAGDSGAVLATEDGGATWRAQQPGADYVSALDFVNVTHGWLLAYPDSVLATTTGGWPPNSQQSALGKASPIPWREAGLLSCTGALDASL